MTTQNQNISDFDPCWPVEEQAQWWVVQMDLYGDDRDIKARFDSWMSQDVAHAIAYHQNDNLWDDMSFAVAGEEEIHCPVEAPTTVPRASRSMRYLSVGMMMCVALLLAWFIPSFNLYQAGHANLNVKTENITLADGSVVTLDSHSAIDVNYQQDRREIKLVSGRAFFKVQPNRERPFVVLAGNAQAEALGTAYSVRMHDTGIDVQVEEGVVGVSVDDAGELVRLHADEGVHLNAGTGHVQKTVLNTSDFGWMKGQLIANNWTVPHLLDELERYSDGQIILLNSSVREKTLSGRFDLSNTQQVVEDVALLLDLETVKITPLVTILK